MLLRTIVSFYFSVTLFLLAVSQVFIVTSFYCSHYMYMCIVLITVLYMNMISGLIYVVCPFTMY